MFKKLLKNINYLKKINFTLKFKNAKYLVLSDNLNSILIKKILYKNTNFIDFPNKINFFIFLITIFKKKKSESFSINYLINYIKILDAKIIISFYDNYVNFYKLKKYFKNRKFISIQNGYRGGPNDFFNTLKKEKKKLFLSADYIFTFNKIIGKEYNKYIKSNIISAGSFRNNFFKKSNKKIKNNTILYISSYTPYDKNSLFANSKNNLISWDQFFKSDEYIFQTLNNFCLKNSIKLSILLKTDDIKEKVFYQNLIKNSVNFIEKKSSFSSYTIINKFKFFVGTENTLSYEILARRKRIVIFATRKKILKKFDKFIDSELNFYWPGTMKETGKYWTHSLSKKKFEKVLDYLLYASDKEWQQELNKIDKNYKINFDFNNLIFRKILQNN